MKLESVIKVTKTGLYKSVYVGDSKHEAREAYRKLVNSKKPFKMVFHISENTVRSTKGIS